MTGFGLASTNGAGTEFLSTLHPPKGELDEYDNTKPFNQQSNSVPQTFRDAMSVREEVFGEQGVPLEAEFDEDDARSWHWVVYASVASSATSPPSELRPETSTSQAEDLRRASATASRLPVGTIRLIPPPHGANKYIQATEGGGTDKHPDADPPPSKAVDKHVKKQHPTEPYIKLGRLAVLAPYRRLGLSKLLINAALDWASKHAEVIYSPLEPVTMELANHLGKSAQKAVVWQGLAMIHAQASVAHLWQKYGFAEELKNEQGEVEITKEAHWVEEGIEHLGMWKRIKVDSGRS
ncbi:hypothetical protein BS50DRAFT_27956 [Corynespora cassiicola Philippines]|uniref:N-acetyltransferase domain-containing protein n=1 Tax=Corynespora cassiicola Philippines TaxID=1448308 RepID=A0A2T2PBA9_CORCC|nr:hypothetical protein BS50DRAFT_27956 [Corynespora cassiicola Philippines]